MLFGVALLALMQCPDGSPPPCRGARVAAPPMSVAVLTFENRSRDSGDAFLGDGLADEIATQLGGVRRLTVRSRTVVRRLRGAESMSVPELGRALSAAYLVNGTIQRAGGSVRVEVELLRASNGDQAWAQRFDQASGDLFHVQSTVAEAVSQAIAGRLAPQERGVIARRPTRSNEAYQLYLQAVSATARLGNADSTLLLLRGAVGLDSTFSEAWALISRIRMNQYFNSVDRSPANLSSGRDAALRAQRLAPDLPETHLALGYVAYWGSLDYGTASAEFDAALRQRPADTDTWVALALIARRQGHFDASVQHLRRALAADPGNVPALTTLETTLMRMHQLGEAVRLADSAEAHGLSPGTTAFWRCQVAFATGDRAAAAAPCHQALAAADPASEEALFVSYVDMLVDSAAMPFVDRIQRPAGGEALGEYYTMATQRWYVAGDSARFRAYADSLIRSLESTLAADSGDANLRVFLGDVYSLVGRSSDALAEVDHALAEVPPTRDAVDGTDALYERALVLARARRLDEALDLLERLHGVPSFYTTDELPLLPGLEFLRDNPRFQRLVARR